MSDAECKVPVPVNAAAIVAAAVAAVDGVDIATLASIAGHRDSCSKNSSPDYEQDGP